MFRRVFQSLLLALSLVLCSVVSAETVQDANSLTLSRPKVALVLSGGGARGFSHVGVIRLHEAECKSMCSLIYKQEFK